MGELAPRRPQSVAEHAEVDYAKALAYLDLNPNDPKAHALVLVCKRYDLDPLLGHVSLYEGKPYIHYAGYLHIALSHPQYDGAECVREWDDDTYYYATVRVHRSDRSFPAERTGRSRKVKPKRNGGTYVDEQADAKAFAQAHRRALRLAFHIAAPDPDDTPHGDVPAPPPVVEVARIIQNQKTSGEVAGTREPGPPSSGRSHTSPDPQSGAGSRATPSTFRDVDASPAPGDQSGTEAADGASPGTLLTGDSASVPDPTSDPPRLAPPAGGGSDPTSTTPARKGKAAGVVGQTSGVGEREPAHTGSGAPHLPMGEVADRDDPTPDPHVDPRPAEEGDAIVDALLGRPAVRGERSQPTEGADAKSKSDDAAGPSPVLAWCEEHGQDIRVARIHLRKSHRTDFGDLTSIHELKELPGERAGRAIAYLDAWLHSAEGGG